MSLSAVLTHARYVGSMYTTATCRIEMLEQILVVIKLSKPIYYIL